MPRFTAPGPWQFPQYVPKRPHRLQRLRAEAVAGGADSLRSGRAALAEASLAPPMA